MGTKRRKRKRKIKGRIPERFLEGDSRVRRGEELRVFSLERLLVRGKIACGLQGFLRGEAAGERVQVSFDFWSPLEIREWRRGVGEIVLQRYFGVVFEDRLKLNRTSTLSGMKARGLLLVFDSYCFSIVVVDILNVV